MFMVFYVHGTVHLSNTSHINTNEMQLIFVSFIWCYNTTCFGRSLRPSSWVIINCSSSHWCLSHRIYSIPNPWQTPVAAATVYNYSWWWTQTASETCRVI